MKNFMQKSLIAIIVSIGVLGAQAQIIEHREYAAEIMNTDFGSVLANGGIFYVKRCDQCATVGVSFNPGTRFYRKSSAISKRTAQDLNGKGATVFFHPKTKLVTRVVFWE